MEVGFAEKVEAIAGGGGHEVFEQERRVFCGQELAENVGGGPSHQLLGLSAQQLAIGLGVPGSGRKLIKRGARLGHTLLWRAAAARVPHADVADDLAQPPAGQHIVADRGHAAGCQMILAQTEYGGPHRLWHPAEHAVANDVVEFFRAQSQTGDVA